MRPKKPRFMNGIQLVDNLYTDPRKRPGYWLYIRPDTTRKTFKAASVEEANALATEANALRDSYSPEPGRLPVRGMTAYHLPVYITYREKVHGMLKKKSSWVNRKYALKAFAESFPRLADMEMAGIRSWWDDLTHSQQKLRMAEFRRFFNWLMGECLVPRIKYNPFTTADDVSRMMLREKPPKKRDALTEFNFHRILAKAEELNLEALQIGMQISLYTTLREGDVCALRFDQNVIDGELRTVVSKSDAQKGSARATRLCWKLDDHPKLRKLINRARELALLNKGCPYVVSHRPIRRVWNEDKQHICQVLPERLSRMFALARDAAGVKNTCFHEVRGLSITLLRKKGYDEKAIQQIAAHESVSTTRGYMDASELPFEEVKLIL